MSPLQGHYKRKSPLRLVAYILMLVIVILILAFRNPILRFFSNFF